MNACHRIVLVRHGETHWSATRRHTGRSDITLGDEGKAAAAGLAEALRGWDFALALSSPLSRAWDTAQLAGLDPIADDDLLEWDYGVYEGRTTDEIRTEIPGWSVWTHEVVGGESLEAVGARADRAIERASRAGGDAVLVAHAHLLRILTARWIGLPPGHGRHFTLDTATVSVLGWERDTRAIHAWNVSGYGG
ncbi:MAG: histidine phosphatase family protein [Ilumatobacteraceae bacterium]